MLDRFEAGGLEEAKGGLIRLDGLGEAEGGAPGVPGFAAGAAARSPPPAALEPGELCSAPLDPADPIDPTRLCCDRLFLPDQCILDGILTECAKRRQTSSNSLFRSGFLNGT